jgi:hypothetical protein
MLKTITCIVAVASVALLLFLKAAVTHGELLCPVDDPECKNRREASLEEKVKQSATRAVAIVVGRLQSDQPTDGMPSSAHRARALIFEVERTYKKALPDRTLVIKVPVYRTGGTAPSSTPARLDDFERLEMQSELGNSELVSSAYQERVRALREAVEQRGTDEAQEISVLPVRLGSSDVQYRITDVPLRVGERYALFIMTEAMLSAAAEGRFVIIADNALDVYALKGTRGERIVSLLANQGLAR